MDSFVKVRNMDYSPVCFTFHISNYEDLFSSYFTAIRLVQNSQPLSPTPGSYNTLLTVLLASSLSQLVLSIASRNLLLTWKLKHTICLLRFDIYLTCKFAITSKKTWTTFWKSPYLLHLMSICSILICATCILETQKYF